VRSGFTSLVTMLQVHDNLGFKFRSSHYNSAGTVKADKLCMDSSETRVVVGGATSQKVGVGRKRRERRR
jgi:hypothetical protein